MKKIFILSLILFLVLFTAIIKNSTKNIEEEIFVINENIGILNNEFESVKLEFEYLSSTEKLIEFKNSYFDDELSKKNIEEIKRLNKNIDGLKITNLKFDNEWKFK